jgi:hypothetical protein
MARTAESPDREVFGFLTPHAQDSTEFTFADRDEDYPETWLEFDAAGNPRSRATTGARARVRGRGRPGRAPQGSRAQGLVHPRSFRFCLRCGATHSTSARDRNRLASLSAEGRSSATTVLVGAPFAGCTAGTRASPRHPQAARLHRQPPGRGAPGRALQRLPVRQPHPRRLPGALDAGGRQGPAQPTSSARPNRRRSASTVLTRAPGEWLLEPTLKGFNAPGGRERTLRQVLAYRVWFDQRRGWRYTNPNLEQLGLVDVEYLGLDELASDESVFATAPDVLRLASPDRPRKAVYTESCSITCASGWRSGARCSTRPSSSSRCFRSLTAASARRGASASTRSRAGALAAGAPPSAQGHALRDEDLIVRGGSRSGLGKILRSETRTARVDGRTLWSDPAVRAEAQGVRRADRGAARGRLSPRLGPRRSPVRRPRLDRSTTPASCSSAAPPDVTPTNRTRTRSSATSTQNLAPRCCKPVHPLFGFEAREHTAQVDRREAAVREKRFRFGRRSGPSSADRRQSRSAKSARPAASCRCSSARRRWSSAWTSRR